MIVGNLTKLTLQSARLLATLGLVVAIIATTALAAAAAPAGKANPVVSSFQDDDGGGDDDGGTATGAGAAPFASAQRPIHVHSGSCEALGGAVAPLTSLAGPAGDDDDGGADDYAVEYSFTGSVPVLLDDLTAGDYAINIRASDDDTDTVIACGNVDGVIDPGGTLAIALRPQNDSGVFGIAVLTRADDGGTTHASVFIAGDRLPDDDDGSGSGNAGSTGGNSSGGTDDDGAGDDGARDDDGGAGASGGGQSGTGTGGDDDGGDDDGGDD